MMGGRSNLQLIEALCQLCDELILLVHKLALRLAELGDVAAGEEAAAASERYRAIIGGGEAPDDAYDEED